jgi:hypothetical protein
MSTLLHYLPLFLFTGLGLLALVTVLTGDDRKKRTAPQRVRHHHYQWNDHHSRRG